MGCNMRTRWKRPHDPWTHVRNIRYFCLHLPNLTPKDKGDYLWIIFFKWERNRQAEAKVVPSSSSVNPTWEGGLFSPPP